MYIKFKRKLHYNVHAQILKTRQVVLFVSALAERGLAIAEQQWSQVLKQLPPAFSRDCYIWNMIIVCRFV